MSKSDVTILEFDSLPSVAPLLLRGALRRRAAREGLVVPRIEASVRGVRTPAGALEAYRRACLLTDESALPATWPQVLALPLHMSILAHEKFPLPLLGLVHVSSLIEERRRIAPGEPLDIFCFVEGSRPARLGVEVDIVTRVEVEGEAVWSSVTTTLVRIPSKVTERREERSPEPPGEEPGTVRSVVWRVPEGLGRRYAAVSGDWNPIHMHALLARPLGFPRAIAHGMWTFARCVGELEGLLPPMPRRFEVRFRRPVLLPATLVFSARRQGEGLHFAVRNREATQGHLEGSVVSLES